MSSPFYSCLWFNGNGREAAEFYCSVFDGASVISSNAVVTLIAIMGQRLMLLDGGPRFSPTEAHSLVVECQNQAEIDRLWSALTADGGSESMCGWLKDKYGVSWQIVPAQIGNWLSGQDEASARASRALMQMRKLDIATLQAAYEGQ